MSIEEMIQPEKGHSPFVGTTAPSEKDRADIEDFWSTEVRDIPPPGPYTQIWIDEASDS